MALERDINELTLEYMIGERNMIEGVSREFLIPLGRLFVSMITSSLLFAHVILKGDFPRWEEFDDLNFSRLYQFWLMVIGLDYRVFALLTNLCMIIPNLAKGVRNGISTGLITTDNVKKILFNTPAGLLANLYYLGIILHIAFVVALCHWNLISVRVIAALCVVFTDVLTEGYGVFLFKDLLYRPISTMLQVRLQERLARLRRNLPPQ